MNFKQIASYDNFMLANMTLGLLQENEINCHLKDENIVTIDPLLNPAVGGIKLMVAETDYPAAVVLLREAEENYLKDIACPKCHTNHLEIKETRNNPAGFWGKLKNQIAFGQTSTYKKEYVCTNCGAVHAEIPASF
jgi:ssDNA-binding Zn-finger/Zn-ribbon topoisomerase 1